MLPAGSFDSARWFNVAGALIAVRVFAWERMHSPTPQPAAGSLPAKD